MAVALPDVRALVRKEGGAIAKVLEGSGAWVQMEFAICCFCANVICAHGSEAAGPNPRLRIHSTGERQASYMGSLPRRSFSINIRDERRFTPAPHGGGSPRAQDGYEPAGHSDDNDTEESIEVVENLLESYFMQIDSSYDRLVSIGVCS